MMTRAYIGSLKSSDYLPLVQEGLEYIRFNDLVSPDSKVFIKPNLTFPEYRPGVMTNPKSIEAAVQAVSDYTPNITVGDSDSGGYNRFRMDQVYEDTGILELGEKYGIKVVNLSNSAKRSYQIDCNGRKFTLDLPVLLLDEIDLLITMPVPKVHSNTQVSLTFKNQWGCIPENTDRLMLHPYFKSVILELNRIIKGKVAIVDGLYGLNKNGPLRGQPTLLNWLLVSNNIGAAARLCCELMQITLASVPHLKYAEKMGWIPQREKIQVNQELRVFITDKFVLHRKITDYPGYLAFKFPWIAYLAYFSPFAGFLHRIMNLVREPFYDYEKYTIQK